MLRRYSMRSRMQDFRPRTQWVSATQRGCVGVVWNDCSWPSLVGNVKSLSRHDDSIQACDALSWLSHRLLPVNMVFGHII